MFCFVSVCVCGGGVCVLGVWWGGGVVCVVGVFFKKSKSSDATLILQFQTSLIHDGVRPNHTDWLAIKRIPPFQKLS